MYGFPNKTTHVSKFGKSDPRFSDEKYQKYLRLKSNSLVQSSLVPNVSTCISQSLDNHGPWVIDLGALDHISGNASLFTSMSSPRIPHLITLTDGSKVAPKGVGQISLSPSLHLESVLFVPNCPFNLIILLYRNVVRVD